MNEGTHSGKGTIRLLGISAERPTNGLYLLYFTTLLQKYVRGRSIFQLFSIKQVQFTLFIFATISAYAAIMGQNNTDIKIS
jgi:hypothetical protein